MSGRQIRDTTFFKSVGLSPALVVACRGPEEPVDEEAPVQLLREETATTSDAILLFGDARL